MLEQISLQVVVIVGCLILAITVHEFAHAFMAWWLGDGLGKNLGRLTLDPMRHIDPIWTVGLPAFLIIMATVSGAGGIPIFGAGKPMPYNPNALDRKFFGKRIPLRYAELLVAAAGPVSNLILAFISLLLILLLLHLGYDVQSEYSIVGLLWRFVYLNVALFVFNLIPIPPLDGSKILTAFLSRSATEHYEAVASRLSWVLLAILIMGGGTVIGVAIQAVVRSMTWLLI
ncbi:MAG: site-2 protease family protein [bacterium]|nr:site-2 protease family protein [bacterium]